MKYLHLVLLFSSMILSSASVIAKPPTDRVTSGILMSTQFPAPSVYIDMMPVIIDPATDILPETPSIDVFMTLSNNSSQPLNYTFPSSKTFDIYIKNQFGEVVTSWSKGKFFLTVITNLTILPGESYTFGGKVELTTFDNTFIDPGDYILSIELDNITKSASSLGTISSTPSSQMPLRIDWVY